MSQTTQNILMIRPVAFRMNEQTAVNNYYQKVLDNTTPETVNAQAQCEFDEFVKKLENIGVNVVVVDDTIDPDTPDSIFPNNWVSFHESGVVVLYPMFAPNRRLERRSDILETLEKKGFSISQKIDYTHFEHNNVFLEGTGNLLLDRVHNKAYCALSPRASEELVLKFCKDLNMEPVIFQAYQDVGEDRKLIYHTNVMMCLAETFAVICLDSIDDELHKKNVIDTLKSTNKEIINISQDQVNNFAGNMLQVQGKEGKRFLVMSTSAYKSLTEEQKETISKHCDILHSSLDTIEACGGGSARCMMAEVFLPQSKNTQ